MITIDWLEIAFFTYHPIGKLIENPSCLFEYEKLRVYLDTSVVNFVFATDVPEKMELTVRFFEDYIKSSKVEAFVSPIVIDEIMKKYDVSSAQKEVWQWKEDCLLFCCAGV